MIGVVISTPTAAQSVFSANFGSFPAGTPAGALTVPGMTFTVAAGASANVDDRPWGRALIYSQQVDIGGLPHVDLIQPAGLEIRFPIRMSKISFDWAIRGRTLPGPVCIIDGVAFLMESQLIQVQEPSHYNGTPCPPPSAPGWSGGYYFGRFEFVGQGTRAFKAGGLVYPGTTTQDLAQTEFVIDTLEVTEAAPCDLGVTEITSPPSNSLTPVTAGGQVQLTWNPASGLSLQDGGYLAATSRDSSFSVIGFQKSTTGTSISIPVPASETDYTLYVGVEAFEFCYPDDYVYGLPTYREFAVKGIPPVLPVVKPASVRPPVRVRSPY